MAPRLSLRFWWVQRCSMLLRTAIAIGGVRLVTIIIMVVASPVMIVMLPMVAGITSITPGMIVAATASNTMTGGMCRLISTTEMITTQANTLLKGIEITAAIKTRGIRITGAGIRGIKIIVIDTITGSGIPGFLYTR